jgi:hypothetical protein
MLRKQLTTGCMALLLGVAAMELPTPAAAGGSASLTITPKGESAKFLQEGLHWYSLLKSSRNRARVDQRGSGNGAAISQHGSNNWASIFQRGQGQSASITQNGNDNAMGVFQFGRKTIATTRQTGNGNVGLVLQGGW